MIYFFKIKYFLKVHYVYLDLPKFVLWESKTCDSNLTLFSLRYKGLKFLLGNVIRLPLISDDMNYSGMPNIIADTFSLTLLY